MSLSFTSCWQFPLKFKHFSPWLLFSQSTESIQNKLPAALWISSSFFPTYFSWDTKQNKPLGYLCAQRQTSNLLKSEPLLRAAAIHEQTWNQISERNFSYVTQINLLIATYEKPDKVVKRPPGRSSVVQRKLLLSKYEYLGTSWQSSGWDPTLLLQGVRVRSLVRGTKILHAVPCSQKMKYEHLEPRSLFTLPSKPAPYNHSTLLIFLPASNLIH